MQLMRNAIVVGGGLAGISAALALQDSGKWNIKLFEAGKTLGGRVSSITDNETGLKLDNCQHACFRIYDHFLQLINRCNAQNSIKFQQKTLLSFCLIPECLESVNGSNSWSLLTHHILILSF